MDKGSARQISASRRRYRTKKQRNSTCARCATKQRNMPSSEPSVESMVISARQPISSVSADPRCTSSSTGSDSSKTSGNPVNLPINESDMTMKQPRWNVLVKLGVVAGVCVLLASCGGDSPESLIKSARDYLAKGDYSAAVIQLRNALQKAPNNADARYLLGTALIERRDPAGAVKELRMAVQLGYPADQALPALARALIDDGDAKELVTEFGESTLGSPDAQAAFKTPIGNALLSLGKTKEAEAAFTAALSAKADFPDALLGVATLRAGSGDLEGAKKIVDAVLAQPRAPPEASLFQARFLFAEGKTDAARATLEKLLEAKPDNLQARYQLASLLIAQGDLA